MLKITELTLGQEKSTLFSEDSFFVGDSHETQPSLTFAGRGLKSEHIKIAKVDGVIWIYNLANDPFVTLNGHPFFKKQVKSGDILKVRDIELKIEEVAQKGEPVALAKEAVFEPLAPPQAPLPLASEADEQGDKEEIIHAPIRSVKSARPKTSLKDFDLPEKHTFQDEVKKAGPPT